MTRSITSQTKCRPDGLNRRTFLQASGYAALIGVTGCTATGQTQKTARLALNQPVPTNGKTSLSGDEFAYYANMYAAQPEEKFPLPAIPVQRIDPTYYRRLVDDPEKSPEQSSSIQAIIFFTLPLAMERPCGMASGSGVPDSNGREGA